ncbi:MAG: hypothetical protein JXM70_03320 [Pirellulales bacterium]|nr:hypothetical protein [Pirellulales bacterium]
MSEAMVTKPPRHLWIVGIVALLWNLLGVVDFILTRAKNVAYMGQFTPEQVEFFYRFPTWLVVFWAVAVWGSVLGIVLLLFRRKLAVHILVASFICMLVTMIHNYGFAGGAAILGTTGLIFSAVVFVIELALIIYAYVMVKKGVMKQ